MEEDTQGKHAAGTEGLEILDLKQKKAKLKTVFTKTRNKIIQQIDFEDMIDKKLIKSHQMKLDTALDNVMCCLNDLYELYRANNELDLANKITQEIENIDREYAETHLYVKEAFETLKSSGSLASDASQEGLQKDLMKMRRVGIPMFNGDKRRYESWSAAFTACIDNSNATPEYKLLQLRQYVEGDALKAIEDLGHSAEAYEAAKSRLERKFGGERRRIMRFIDDLDKFAPLKSEDAYSMEKFADLLDLAVINMKEAGKGDDLGNGSLYYSLQKKMPESMLSRYHRWIFETSETESVETLRNWVVQESSYLTIASETKNGFMQTNKGTGNRKSGHSSYFNEDTKGDKKNCTFCNGSHRIWNCSKFKNLEVSERWQKARELKLCFRCLNDNHTGKKCKKFRKCTINECNKTHNSLLHSDIPVNTNPIPNSNLGVNQQSFYNAKTRIALRTVPVVLCANGKNMKVNALLDDGSTKTYISQDIASALGLNGKIEHVKVNVLSGKTENFESMAVNLGLQSLNGQVNISIDASVIDTVTGSLQTVDWNRHGKKWEHLREIKFPVISNKDKIDILIGLDYAQLHTSLHEIHGEPHEPIARLTPLGWTCVGKIDDTSQTSLFSTYFVQGQNEMNDIMKGFWEIDSYGTHKQSNQMLSQEEKQVLAHTEETLEFKDGLYEVSIPWKKEPNMSNNYKMAEKRLSQTMKKLDKDPVVKAMYADTINKYLHKGYITKVSVDENRETDPEFKWYLPHFPVVHMNRQTTKVRIVFDAAAKYEGFSLNDYIHQGPKLQNELFDVLLRFRKHDIAVVCDISEMYLRVGIVESDRRFHRFLWDGSEFQFNRLVFGVNASPYLAQYVAQHNARRYADIYPAAADTVLNSTYMDDSMDSVCTEEEGVELYLQLSELWKKAGMYAKKWLSNSTYVLEHVPIEDRVMEVDLDSGYLPVTKTLGIIWGAEQDIFSFKMEQKELNDFPKITKRTLLKKVASIFDPLGFISPFVVRGKILMQRMWRYVPTRINPADMASRGTSADNLLQSDLWWKGPEFLYSPPEMWPENKIEKSTNENVVKEMKKSSASAYVSVNQNQISENKLNPANYSSWLKLVRVKAWVNRFIENCRSPNDKCLESELTVDEIRESENFFIRQAQISHFKEEYLCLNKGQSLSSNSKILSLNVKLDENGIMRCDTRLRYAEFLPYNTRFPIVLPRKSRVTKLLVKHHHELSGHSGTNQTLAILSSNYWLISGREEIREWERECAYCKKMKSSPGMQLMAPLPKARTEKSMRAFAYCSVDFGGPFLTRQGRGKARQKRYLCLFTCMATRAVHLELAYGLDTDSFLNAFYRMVSRRGFPNEMYSDNGTNFVGAYKELKELVDLIDKDKVTRTCSRNGIKWYFNPPLAPHFGGIHESMIKTAKRALYKVLNSADVTDEELLTAFIGAEGLINSRPIAYQTSNPADDCVLTPNHFLHGQMGGHFAPESVDETVFDIRKRWRRVQEIVKHFWQRWLREFLPTLSGRKKWYKETRDFRVGDVVLVIDQDKPRGQWSLGKIIDAFPGKDGHVRVVNVQVGKTVFRRPITKLCLIEKSE